MNVLKLVLRITVSIAISGLFVWLSLRNAPIRQVAQAIADCDKTPLLLYTVLLLFVHLVRTVRWGILLEPLGHVGFSRLNSASAVGFMLLIVLPLRLGELARPLLIARPPVGRGAHLRRSGAMASVVVERIADGLFVGLLGVLALRALGARAGGDNADFARRAAVLVSLGFFTLCVLLVAAFFLRERALELATRLLSPLSPKLAGRVTSMVDAFIGALHLGSGWKVLGFLGLTALYWACATGGLLLVAPAFGIHLGPLEACAVLAIQVVGAMVPAGPGMVGTLQFFTQTGLSLFVPGALGSGPEGVHAAAYANTVWLLQFGQQVGLGLIFMAMGHVSLRGLLGKGGAEDEAAPPPGATAAWPEAARDLAARGGGSRGAARARNGGPRNRP